MKQGAGTLSRTIASAFINEPGKTLLVPKVLLAVGAQPNWIPIASKVIADAELMVRISPDGDFALQAVANKRSSVICRWDRSPHLRPHTCAETGNTILGGHKHYFERNVGGSQRIVERGEQHIPTKSVTAAVKAFCDELAIQKPTHVSTIKNLALEEVL